MQDNSVYIFTAKSLVLECALLLNGINVSRVQIQVCPMRLGLCNRANAIHLDKMTSCQGLKLSHLCLSLQMIFQIQVRKHIGQSLYCFSRSLISSKPWLPSIETVMPHK